MFHFSPTNFDMFFEALIVGVGEIASEVDASTFFAFLGCLGHQERYREHILAFPALGRVKDFVHHVSLPEFDNLLGLNEGLGLSCDGDISPHKGPEGVSNVSGIQTSAV